jgi:hypothetical protein
MLRLRVSGAMLLLSVCAFMSWGDSFTVIYRGIGLQTLKCELRVLECVVGMAKSRECIWRLRAMTRPAPFSFFIVFPRLPVTVGGHTYIYVHFIHTYTHIHIYVRSTYSYIHITHTHTHIHTYIHTYIQTYIHTHTYDFVCVVAKAHRYDVNGLRIESRWR